MTTIENWNSPREKSVILFYPCANVNFRCQSCISQPDQKRHSWLLSLFLDRWVFTSFVTLTQFVNVKAMVGTRSTKKNKIFARRKKLTTPYIHVKARARSCSVHYHSHGILAPPILMQLQSNMRDDKYRRVGCWGHRLHVLAQPFYAHNTLHTLSLTISSERTCRGWAVSHWTHLWRCSLFKLNSRNLARARCRGRFLPPSITGIVSSTQVKEGHKPPAQVPQVW